LSSLAADRPNILLIFTDDRWINDVGRQIKVAGSEEAMVPDMGMGGASFGYGNATFAITTATVPDAGSTAALLALSVVALAFARRRLG